MTSTIGKMSSNKFTSEGIRCVAAFVLLTLFVVGFPVGVRAAEEQTGPFLFTSSTRATMEIEIVAKIRQALRQDARLRPLNLGVQMNGGVASLSGPVPTAELKERAIKITERVDGVLAVNAKDLYISTSEQSRKRITVVIQDEPPTQTRSASPGPPSLVGSWNVDSPGTKSPSIGNEPITLRPPEMAASAAPTLPDPKLAESKAAGARLMANPHPVAPAVSISLAIEQLRQRELRYQQIRARVQGTTVFVFPGDTASEDAMTFAQAVRRLPGVQHVVLSSNSR